MSDGYTKDLEKLIEAQFDIVGTLGKIIDIHELRISILEENIQQLRKEIEYEKTLRANDAK